MVIFSGIQPTGRIHIGNYFGAVNEWVKLQEIHTCFICIVDLHAITAPYNPQDLQNRIFETAIYLVASGIDPEKSVLFIQSRVKEHSELCWLLNSITPIGDLTRMHQYKEKVKKFKKNPNAGLLNYPILQAADIFLYNTDFVPVGEDQLQHIELAREIGKRFNNKFKSKTFKIPEALINKNVRKIMSLNDPFKKMSKTSPEGCIFLDDTKEDIILKIKSATTDSDKFIKFDPNNKPGISNLILIYQAVTNKGIKDIENEFKNSNYSNFKEKVFLALNISLDKIRKEIINWRAKESQLKDLLNKNSIKAREIAEKKTFEVKKVMGLT